jgi:hypothetical protein
MARNSSLALCSLLAACATVGNDRRIPVADAERAFAADAQARTVNEAFVKAFAPDGIMFRPTPLNAHQALASRPMAPAMLLLWTPTSAETAAAGDLGVTTGPSQWGTRGQAPTGTGYFLSVWRAEGKGWKVAFDAGIEGPIPAPIEQIKTISTRTLQPSPSRSDDIEQMRNDIMHLERQLIDDYPARFAEHAASDVRLYRNGSAPTATVGEAVGRIHTEGEISWTPQAAFVSKSGDLGYVYGVAKDAKEYGYVRIWRNQDGNWRIAYDLH